MGHRPTDKSARIVTPSAVARRKAVPKALVVGSDPSSSRGSGASAPPLQSEVESWLGSHPVVRAPQEIKRGVVARKLAHLTIEEKRARDKAIDFYRYIGKVEADAIGLAWVDIQQAFPRLREYDAAQATT